MPETLVKTAPRDSTGAPHVETLLANVDSELELMAPVVPREARGEVEAIRTEASELLRLVESAVHEGTIIPGVPIRLSAAEPPAPVTRSAIRVGVYPVVADPLHWGHVLDGLAAAANLALDAVVYVVLDQASDGPTVFSRELRHEMARRLLDMFAPLLRYSSVAAGTRHDGPEALFDLLDLNPRQMIEVCYLAAMDPRSPLRAQAAFRRTVQALQLGMADSRHLYSGQRTPLTAGFLGELLEPPPASAPPAVFLPTSFLSLSAMEVVAAMSGSGRPGCFARLPYTIYRHVLRVRQGEPVPGARPAGDSWWPGGRLSPGSGVSPSTGWSRRRAGRR